MHYFPSLLGLAPSKTGLVCRINIIPVPTSFLHRLQQPVVVFHIVREFNHFQAQSGGQFTAGGLVYSKE